jgi:hypothetical protein
MQQKNERSKKDCMMINPHGRWPFRFKNQKNRYKIRKEISENPLTLFEEYESNVTSEIKSRMKL